MVTDSIVATGDQIVRIDVAREFSAYPIGRDIEDGPDNGARFRDEILIDRYREAVSNNQRLVINIDGVRSFGSSFLDEAFGGLVRRYNINKKEALRNIDVETNKAPLQVFASLIKKYIEEA